MRRFVFGILAHVDSGKTTLSEGLLYHAGSIRKMGRVDHKDAFLDTHSIERDRGITIFSKQAILEWEDTRITLLDTPGHIDFSAEMERTLHVLDYAILVISGTDGVQSHTRTLWNLLERYNVPTFIFVNKMDLEGAKQAAIEAQLKEKLSEACVSFTNGFDEEEVSVCDENLLNEYLENGSMSKDGISLAVFQRKLFPCYFGSALKMDGICDLADGIIAYTNEAETPETFGARVFKISEDEQGNRLTHLKITGGSLKVKSLLSKIENEQIRWEEKVNQIRLYSGLKFQTVDEVYPGDVCAVTGITKALPGNGLGVERDARSLYTEPVLSYRVVLPTGMDVTTVLSKFRILEEEDPELRILWNEQLKEIQVQLMGEVQLEVLQRVIAERFGFAVSFSQGRIAYKETIQSPVEGVGHYEPLRHYAEVHLLMEPLPAGSGLVFSSDCSEDVLDKNWQRLILTHLNEKTHLGVLTGSPVTDMKITLIAGRAHLKHTEGGDFRQATYRAVRHGLMSATSVLLEPWYEFDLELPAECVGRAMTDVSRMGGECQQTHCVESVSYLSGSAPVAKMRDYHLEVVRYTHGLGRLACRVKGYEPCQEPEAVISEIGYQWESDLENTPDSVFCSHGAGFNVKWDQVREYMHIDTGLSFSGEPEAAPEPTVKANRYLEKVYNDEELLAIFERTYGPIKRREYEVFHSPKKEVQTPYKSKMPKRVFDGTEYVLVDGYNIIFAWEEYKKLAEQSLEAARQALIDRLCNYQGYTQCELILVFDAYKVKNNPGEVEKVHNISVVYTKEAETADMYIEKATHQLGKHHKVRVATSDNLEQLIILGQGALRISADAFLKEVETAEAQIRAVIESK
ncbi:MAG: TetM/TetW/TetO/TetS family tetracycline resistance ribosomal protection protein [Clostridia bacterium]|nr:TetM/TetW/TetO/TetS family tetracycline resistance ribosomal protection protein [Clostridia bacterium]